MARRHAYVRIRNVGGVVGLLDYTNNKRQDVETLLSSAEVLESAFTEKHPEGDFWQMLSAYDEVQHHKFGHSGNRVEAKELVVAFPTEMLSAFATHSELAEHYARWFYDKYNVSVNVALHVSQWMSDGSPRNPHLHIVFSERRFLGNEKVARQNLWRDSSGNLVTKKEVAAREGESFTLIPKGEVDHFASETFSKKDRRFITKEFLREVKNELVNETNMLISSKKLKSVPLTVFNPNDIYLPQSKIGKHQNQELVARLTQTNEIVKEYNLALDEQLEVFEAQETEIYQPELVDEFTEGCQELKKQFLEGRKVVTSKARKTGNSVFTRDGWTDVFTQTINNLFQFLVQLNSRLFTGRSNER